jgi:hypothetical protein
MAIAATRPRQASAGAVAVTVLLTVACLVKGVMLPALALWIWWLVRIGDDHRRRAISLHVAAITALVLASVVPFRAGWHTLAPFATLGGVEVWASPSHLVGRAVQAIVASLGGSTAAGHAARVAVVGAFLLLFVLIVLRLARRVDRADAASPTELWGVALLLLALTMPYLLPWYAAWFAPFIGLFADEALVLTGALVTGVLALTLIPADPFHGRTSAPVMNGVHYGAAPVLLVVLLVVIFRVGATRSGDNRSVPRIAAPEENELGSAVAG